MNISQVAAQLYTVRDLCKTPAQTADVLKKIRALGYEAVQVSGICEIATPELLKITRDAGIKICSMHDAPAQILEQPAKVAARLTEIGCKYTAYPYPAGVDVENEAQLNELVKKLREAGRVLAEAGQTLCYHHHSLEFVRHGKSTVLDYIFEQVEPRHLSAELDTYWVQHGGGDPVEWCARMKNRLPVLHMKDFGSSKGQPIMTEIGNGNLNWKKIIAAAEASGCEWFVVEQDTCPGDPLDSLKISFDYIRANLVS